MKVLLFCPTYRKPDGNLALHEKTRQSIDALQHGGHEVTEWVSVDDTPNKHDNVIAQYRKAWKRAKASGYDAILTVEHDMIVPPDALVKLAEVEADIVYGVYLFRESATLNALRRVATPCVDQPLSIFPDEMRRAMEAKIYPVSGCGFGCTLIRRSAFETLTLRKPEGGHYPDMPLANDALKAGLTQMARFDVICGHIRTGGEVLWPTFDRDALILSPCTVMPRQKFYGNVNGQSVRFIPGEKKVIPLGAAREFARASLLEIVSLGEDVIE